MRDNHSAKDCGVTEFESTEGILELRRPYHGCANAASSGGSRFLGDHGGERQRLRAGLDSSRS